MKKALLLVLPLVAHAAVTTVSEPAYWRFAHSDAKVLAGVEWKRMANTPAGLAMRTASGKADMPGLAVSELLDQIDRLLISSPGGGNAKLSKQPPVLAIATGHFDLAKLRKLATSEKAALRPYKNAEFVYPAGYKAGDNIVAFVDAQTILIGEKQILTAAIDKARSVAGPLSAFNPLYARAARSAGQFDMWLISSVSPAEFSGEKNPQMAFLNDVTGMDLGVDLHNGLGMGFRMATKSVEKAENLAGMMRMLMAFASSQAGKEHPAGAKAPATDKEMEAILQSIEIRTEASDVRVSVKITQAQLEKSIQQAMFTAASKTAKPAVDLGGFKQPATPQSSIRQTVPVDVTAMARKAAPAPATQAAPEPPRKQVIRIEGLDEGPREIPYTQEKRN